jgi:hypothetical protein
MRAVELGDGMAEGLAWINRHWDHGSRPAPGEHGRSEAIMAQRLRKVWDVESPDPRRAARTEGG